VKPQTVDESDLVIKNFSSKKKSIPVVASFLNTLGKEGIMSEYLHPAQYNERLRLRNDTETFFAESLYGSMRTPLEYIYDPIANELRAEDGGWLGPIFDASINNMQKKVSADPEYEFELRRRIIEKEEYQDMLNLMDDERVNTMVVVSDFPKELVGKNGHFGGYDTERQQAYVRVMTRNGDTLQMFSQSLDGSDREGLEKIYAYMGFTPHSGELLEQRMQVSLLPEHQEILIDSLQLVYDNHMQHKTGIKHYAGIPIGQTNNIDTYAFVKTQKDIIGLAITLSENNALTPQKQYDMLALLRERFESKKAETTAVVFEDYAFDSIGKAAIIYAQLSEQSQQAGARAKTEGRTFSACGITLRSQETSAEDGLKNAGYSQGIDNSKEDKFGPLSFECPKGHTNTRPRNKLIDKCQKCGISVRC